MRGENGDDTTSSIKERGENGDDTTSSIKDKSTRRVNVSMDREFTMTDDDNGKEEINDESKHDIKSRQQKGANGPGKNNKNKIQGDITALGNHVYMYGSVPRFRSFPLLSILVRLLPSITRRYFTLVLHEIMITRKR